MLPASELALAGAQPENALAAMAGRRLPGLRTGCLQGLRRFHGLPHRTGTVVESAGVLINDSKGTNVDATAVARALLTAASF
jgi:UDP-N-acetylmuramoylalanine-D-glutamate ligase